MSYLKTLKSIADKLGASIEIDTIEGATSVEVLAPDGMEWVESGGISLVGTYYKNWPESKSECFTDLIERVKQGLQNEE